MVRLERFELPAFWFVARRSIQLSYGRTRFVEEPKTDYQGLGGDAIPLSRGCGLRCRRRRNEWKFLCDLKAGAADELGDGGRIEAGGIVFDTQRVCRAIEAEAANAVDVPSICQSKYLGVCGRCGIAKQNLDRGHKEMIARVRR